MATKQALAPNGNAGRHASGKKTMCNVTFCYYLLCIFQRYESSDDMLLLSASTASEKLALKL